MTDLQFQGLKQFDRLTFFHSYLRYTYLGFNNELVDVKCDDGKCWSLKKEYFVQTFSLLNFKKKEK